MSPLSPATGNVSPSIARTRLLALAAALPVALTLTFAAMPTHAALAAPASWESDIEYSWGNGSPSNLTGTVEVGGVTFYYPDTWTASATFSDRATLLIPDPSSGEEVGTVTILSRSVEGTAYEGLAPQEVFLARCAQSPSDDVAAETATWAPTRIDAHGDPMAKASYARSSARGLMVGNLYMGLTADGRYYEMLSEVEFAQAGAVHELVDVVWRAASWPEADAVGGSGTEVVTSPGADPAAPSSSPATSPESPVSPSASPSVIGAILGFGDDGIMADGKGPDEGTPSTTATTDPTTTPAASPEGTPAAGASFDEEAYEAQALAEARIKYDEDPWYNPYWQIVDLDCEFDYTTNPTNPTVIEEIYYFQTPDGWIGSTLAISLTNTSYGTAPDESYFDHWVFMGYDDAGQWCQRTSGYVYGYGLVCDLIYYPGYSDCWYVAETGQAVYTDWEGDWVTIDDWDEEPWTPHFFE